MHCPKCGVTLCFCESCKRLDNLFTENKDAELFVCKKCRFTRPLSWWDSLELDINTEMAWAEEVIDEEIPEELAGYCESPWGD